MAKILDSFPDRHVDAVWLVPNLEDRFAATKKFVVTAAPHRINSGRGLFFANSGHPARTRTRLKKPRGFESLLQALAAVKQQHGSDHGAINNLATGFRHLDYREY